MKSILFTISVLFLMGTNNLLASHFAGSGITYKCVGGNAYQITMSFYRDCSGIPEPNTINVSFKCSSNPTYNFNASLQKMNGTGLQITPTCTQNSACSGGSFYGVQEFIYQGLVNLIPCDSWVISYESCCRNNLNNVNGQPAWYVRAILNNLQAPCNSSPYFTNKPVFVACNNKTVNYNPGAVDNDNDSLVYSFYPPMTSAASIINYNPPYSYTNFLSSSTPITLNSHTGDISFTPNLIQSTAAGVKVEEYRNINGTPTLVGSVMWDLQIKVVDCGNNSFPVLSGMDLQMHPGYDSTDTIYNIVHHINNGDVKFYIHGHDDDTAAAGNFTITWDNGIPSAYFTHHNNGTDSAYAEFLWEYSQISNNVSNIPYCFTAKISDDYCPFHAERIYKYCIKIAPPNTSVAGSASKETRVRVFPVPASDDIFFEMKNGEKISLLQVFDIQGRKIKELKSLQKNSIDISELKAGTYYYRLFTAKNIYNGQFIKK